jgi:hypothetical protein
MEIPDKSPYRTPSFPRDNADNPNLVSRIVLAPPPGIALPRAPWFRVLIQGGFRSLAHHCTVR